MKEHLKHNFTLTCLVLLFFSYALGLVTKGFSITAAFLFMLILLIPIIIVAGCNMSLIKYFGAINNKIIKTLGLVICPLVLLLLALVFSTFTLMYIWSAILAVINIITVQRFKNEFYAQ